MDERQRTTCICERHGSPLYLLGCAITRDSDRAADAAARAIAQTSPPSTESSRGDAELLRRELGRRVYLDCVALEPPSGGYPRHSDRPDADASSLPMVAWLWSLPPQQRASIALCVFGGHTYREAATLLGLAAADVAGLLHSACTAAPPPPLHPDHPTEDSPSAQAAPGEDPAQNPRKAALTNNIGGDV
ncbi:MAG: sigma factor-like helix-turn-helix DNA-binding protein [Nocardioidaceae bacterium]